MTDDPLFIYLRLVKAKYGSLSEVKQMNAREVIQALYYENFLADYQSAYIEINKE